MATAYIEEYSNQARDPASSSPLQMPDGFVTSQALSFTTTAGTSAAFAATTRFVVVSPTVDCIYTFGTAPDVTATGHTGRFIGAGQSRAFRVNPGDKVQVKALS